MLHSPDGCLLLSAFLRLWTPQLSLPSPTVVAATPVPTRQRLPTAALCKSTKASFLAQGSDNRGLIIISGHRHRAEGQSISAQKDLLLREKYDLG